MNLTTLDKLKRELNGMRRSPQRAKSLESLAKRLGRTSFTKRGKEPIWINRNFPALRPCSIPHHGGKDLATGTKNNILDSLEEDVLVWEEKLRNEQEAIK